MLATLRKLGAQSAIYGVPDILTRLIGFLLIPIYTRILAPSDYGVMAVLGSLTQLLGIAYWMGLNGAAIRYFHHFEPAERRRFYGTIWTFLNLVAWPISLLISTHARAVCGFLFHAPEYGQYLRLSVLGTACTVATIIPAAVFYMRERVWTVLFTGLLGCLVAAGAPLYCVLVLKMGLLGVFAGTLGAQAFSYLFMQIFIWPEVKLGIDRKHLGLALAFGLPLVPHLGAHWVLNFADRYMLQRLAGEAETGLYSLGYNFGLILMFVTGAINTAWTPHFYRINADEPAAAPRSVARIFTYYTILVCLATYCVAAFSKEVIGLMAGEHFRSAYRVVPLIAATYLLQGFYFMSVNGIFLRNRNRILPLTTGLAAAANIGLNLLWIPRFGMMGAAWATLISYALLFALTARVAQQCYPVPWEYGRVAKVLLAYGVCAIIAACSSAGHFSLWQAVAIKGGGLLAVPIMLLLTRFPNASEMAAIRKRWRPATDESIAS